MLEHIPRLPRARPTRLPIALLLVLLAFPIVLSALHGYESTRTTQALTPHNINPVAGTDRERLVYSEETTPDSGLGEGRKSAQEPILQSDLDET